MNEEEKLPSESSEAPETSEASEAPEAPGTTEPEQPSPPPRRRSVFVYLAVLFGTAFLLLLFAYLMQQRDSEEIMGNLSDLRQSLGSIQSIDQLVEENHQLREEKEGLKEQVSGMETELAGVKENLEEAEESVRGKSAEVLRSEDKLKAYHVLSQVRILYDDGNYQEASELMLWRGTFMTLEEALTEINEELSDQDLKAYDPLAEWQTLKDALAEEEDAG